MGREEKDYPRDGCHLRGAAWTKRVLIGKAGKAEEDRHVSHWLEMEAFFGKQFYLELFVKVKPDWRESPEFLNG